MKTISGLRKRLQRVLTARGEQAGPWGRLVRYQVRLARFCFLRLRQNNAMAMSAALSFRTIFALVPTLVLVFLVMRSLGQFETRAILRGFLDKAGLSQIMLVQEPEEAPGNQAGGGRAARDGQSTRAAAPEKVALGDRLEKVIAGVEKKLTLGRIGPVGALLVVWAAVTLLTTVERSLNRIFQAPRSRSLARRVLLYWAAVTFIPVALGAADYIAGKITIVFTHIPGVSALLASVGWAGPIVVSSLLLAAVYMFMPNTAVRFRYAIAGAIVAVPLWMLVKWGFVLYVSEFVRNRSLYGALGLIPLFLIWLNFCWLVFLFGAQLAYTAANLESLQLGQAADKIILGPWDMLAAALAVARPYLAGEGPVSLRQVAEKLKLPDEPVRRMLERLCEVHVICPVRAGEAEAYVLAMPADKIPVMAILDSPASAAAAVGRTGYDDDISEAIADMRRQAGEALKSATLGQIAREHQKPGQGTGKA